MSEVRFRPHPFEGKTVLSLPTAVLESIAGVTERDYNGWTWDELDENQRRTAVVLVTVEALEKEHKAAVSGLLDEIEDLTAMLERRKRAEARRD